MIDSDLCNPVKSQVTWVDLEPVIECLRGERIKLNTDYAIMLKYGNVRVVCYSVYHDSIESALKYYGIPFTIIQIEF